MDIVALYLAHPVWWWVGAAALFLAVEVATGSGYLLWPSGAATVVAILALAVRLPPPADLAIFAVLTIVSTLAARRWLPRRVNRGPDVNDQHDRLAGRQATAVAGFVGGEGRVFCDGKEWAAELDGAGEVAAGTKVLVAKVLDGGRLKVRAG